MAKPEGQEEQRNRRFCRTSLVSLGVALLAVAGLTVCVMCLDARRRDQVAELDAQLNTLRLLVESMQKQLDRHEENINSTFQTKSTVSSEPAEEAAYEEEYEYDDEEGSYEYDDEDEPNSKTTVKRTTVLGDSTLSSSSTQISNPRTHEHSHIPAETARSRRDVRSQAVPVREERYVPSSPQLKAIMNSKNKSEGLRIYASYFGKPSKFVGSSEQTHHLKYSINEPMEDNREDSKQTHKSKSLEKNKLQSENLLHSTVYQEQRRAEETVVRLRHGGRNRKGNIEDIELVSQDSAEDFKNSRNTDQHLVAHFVGDASHYNTRDDAHYFGNNIMFHPNGLFKDWVPSNWMFELGMSTNFPIYDGKLSIQNPGIYFVYAQVYYAAINDRCGFHIKHNGEEVAQCMIMTTGRTVKRNTCFTAVVLRLNKTDQLCISEVEGFRNTSFKSSHSFFGLILLKSI